MGCFDASYSRDALGATAARRAAGEHSTGGGAAFVRDHGDDDRALVQADDGLADAQAEQNQPRGTSCLFVSGCIKLVERGCWPGLFIL